MCWMNPVVTVPMDIRVCSRLPALNKTNETYINNCWRACVSQTCCIQCPSMIDIRQTDLGRLNAGPILTSSLNIQDIGLRPKPDPLCRLWAFTSEIAAPRWKVWQTQQSKHVRQIRLHPHGNKKTKKALLTLYPCLFTISSSGLNKLYRTAS